MSSKKDAILGKNKPEKVQYLDLTNEEILEIASLVALVEQAQAAQNYIYARIVQNVGQRYEIIGKDISLNFEEIMEKGAKVAKLVVKDVA